MTGPHPPESLVPGPCSVESAVKGCPLALKVVEHEREGRTDEELTTMAPICYTFTHKLACISCKSVSAA